MRTSNSWLLECPDCGFLRSTLKPGAGVAIHGLDSLRRMNSARILDNLSRHMPLAGAKVLEIGAGRGLFLDEARARGCQALAIEPDSGAAAECRSRGHTVIDGFFPDAIAPEAQFQIIALNDVFEHLPDPDNACVTLQSLLAPDGILVINLPSRNGVFFRLATLLDWLGAGGPLDRLWQRGLPSPHLSYFNRSTLDRLVARTTGLTALDPLWLPSVTRTGLRARLASAPAGIPVTLSFPLIWLASWFMPLLPKDIFVGLYANRTSPAPGS